MNPTRRLFLVTWAAVLAVVWVCGGRLAEARETEFVILGIVAITVPCLAGPGLMPWLRRMPGHLISLPHSEYWFAPDHREASLLRLQPFVDVMGTMLAVFLGAVVLLYTGERVDPLLASFSAMLFLLAAGAFLAGTGLWMRAVLRAFAAPQGDAASGRAAARSSAARAAARAAARSAARTGARRSNGSRDRGDRNG